MDFLTANGMGTGSIAAIAVGYLLGSIPFGLIFTRLAGLGDIRSIGSGNIGATNVLRTGRKGLAAATLLADAAKGAAAVLIFSHWSPDGSADSMLAGFAAFIGHLYPVWLRFKGGKGVATYLGVLAAVSLKVFGVFAAVWLIVALIFRWSSAAALAAAALAPIAFWALYPDDHAAAAMIAIMSALIFWKHRANIARLWRGEEPKIGAPKL